MNRSSYLPVSWPPSEKQQNIGRVRAVTTLRSGGYSSGNYGEFNLALHVDDDAQYVLKNRDKLNHELALPSTPVWLDQVHSNRVIDANESTESIIEQADASYTRVPGVVCAVLTADCLPVFFCNRSENEVAVAHAGWRGLHAGIISETVASMSSPVDDILVHLGPAIGSRSFEVGDDVYKAFAEKDIDNVNAFISHRPDHYLCDIYQLARIELLSLGISRVSGGEYDTYSDETRFYSYRRTPQTGRMASLIWIE